LGPKHVGEVVEAYRRIGMLGAEHLYADRQRIAKQWCGLRVSCAPVEVVKDTKRASSVGLPPLALSGALLVRRDYGDASMHRVHDLAPRLGVKRLESWSNRSCNLRQNSMRVAPDSGVSIEPKLARCSWRTLPFSRRLSTKLIASP
jgi:hypothetical protein